MTEKHDYNYHNLTIIIYSHFRCLYIFYKIVSVIIIINITAVITIKTFQLLTIIILICHYNHKYQFSQCTFAR